MNYSHLPPFAHSKSNTTPSETINSGIRLLDRRRFLKITGLSAGAGLILGACSQENPVGDSAAAPDCDADTQLNLFIRINCNNSISLVCHRSEMGQGIRTSLPQVLADELEADWNQITVEQATGDAKYGNQNTDGSRSMRHFYMTMRELGASARHMLEQAAAQTWNVSTTDVRADRGSVVNLINMQHLSYGELAQTAAALAVPDIAAVRLKTPAEFKYIGKGLGLVDQDAITNGSAIYGYDIQIPNMVYASIERCPVLGGKLLSCDESEARKYAGVIDIITLPQNTYPVGFQALHGVAVIANTTWAAMQGRKKLKCEWNGGKNNAHNSSDYLQTLKARVKTPGTLLNERGDIDKAFADASKTHEAIYTLPYLPHATMEPPVATALVGENSCEIWASTQSPQAVRKTVAEAIGMEPEQVTVNVTLLGGGFGRKSKADFSVEAALLSQKTGKPVKVSWTREDDIKFDYLHSISAQYYKAAFDTDNKVSGWLQRSAFPGIMSLFNAENQDIAADWEFSIGFDELPPDVKNFRSEKQKAEAHVRIGWVRSVHNIHHAFARSSFIDELAQLANTPAPEFLEKIIGPDRIFDWQKENWKYGNYEEKVEDFPPNTALLKGVVRKVVASSGYKKLPEGEGWGLAAHRSFTSYVAVASRIKIVDRKVSVEEVHCAIDCGLAVNPDRVKSQIEGAIIFGMSIALSGEITATGGTIDQNNFDDTPLVRINQSPAKIVVHIMPSNERPAGVGEPGVPPVAPSITNAIFAASGERIRELPINKTLEV